MSGMSEAEKQSIDAEYDNLYAIIADAVNAACRSDILCQGFRPTGTEDEYHLYGSNTMLYPNGSIYVPDEGFVPDINGWNPGPRRDHFAEAIGQAFVDWDLLPDRAASQPMVDAARDAAGALQLETTAQATSADGVPALSSGSTALAHDLRDALNLQGFRGAAMDTLKSQFTSYLPGTIQGQYAVAAVVGSALVAEQDVWVRARHDITQIAKALKDAMENANPFDGDQGGAGEYPVWLNVVSAVVGATAAFFTGGATIGAVAGAVRTLGFLADAGPEDTPGPLGASTPDEVLGKLTEAISTLKENITSAERQIAQGCVAATSTVQSSADGTYVLPAIKALTDDDPNAYISDDGETRFTLESLTGIGGTYLPNLVKVLDAARGDNARACDYAAFARPAGFGDNPYTDFSDISRVLDEALEDTVWKVGHVGEQLVLFAKEFKAVDEGAGAEIQVQRKKLDDAAAANRGGSGHSVDFPTGDRFPNGAPVPQ